MIGLCLNKTFLLLFFVATSIHVSTICSLSVNQRADIPIDRDRHDSNDVKQRTRKTYLELFTNY